ncbi:DUF3263 domain-containing protein [Curtobacterium sp. MCPF17_046]|nr:DUF3263 domain-containing protein [Curtobacterium sp. MCPF17_046]PYY46941.1 DUF3263 domain-containing protein [Curtobacterium sp. MCBD17_023]
MPGSTCRAPLRCARPATRSRSDQPVTALPADELTELAKHVLAFEHDRARHDRTKEAEIRVEFDMSPTRYYQVLNRVIDTPAALAYDPQLVTRLQRLRSARTSARAARSFVAPPADPEGREEER